MDSFKVLQLLAHNIQHPKVLDFLSRYRMTVSWSSFPVQQIVWFY